MWLLADHTAMMPKHLAYTASVMLTLGCVLGAATTATAMNLTGILIHAASPDGSVAGPIWHTGIDRSGRVLGVTRWPPPGLRSIPFANLTDTSIDIPLLLMSHTTTLFWQFLPGELPPAMVLNLYFNGNSDSPQISAFVPLVYGLTQFYANPAPWTLSLGGNDTDNSATLSFDDGAIRARLGVAFYMPSVGEVSQWRPADFVNLDRVGTDRLEPDGQPDGIMVFELVVEASQSKAPVAPPARGPAGGVVTSGNLVPILGENKWTPPPTPNRLEAFNTSANRRATKSRTGDVG